MADDDKWDSTPSHTGYRRIEQITEKHSTKSDNEGEGESSGSSDSSSSSSSSKSSDSEEDYDEKKDTVVTTGIISTYQDALDFAKWFWHKIQRDNGRKVQCQVWGSPLYKVGEWARVFLPSFNIDEYMYITNVSQSNDGGDWTCNLTLVDFPPGWGKEEKEEEKDDDDEDDSDDGSSVSTSDTINAIIKDMNKFSYSNSCSDAKCLKSTKKGDCHALSDYIFNRLKDAGIPAKIHQYKTSSSDSHRQVEYKAGSSWTMFPYSKSKIDHNFYTNEIPSKTKIYKEC